MHLGLRGHRSLVRWSAAATFLASVVLSLPCTGEQTPPPQEFPRRNAVVAAVERTGPAVVNISTERIVVQRFDPFYGRRDRFIDPLFEQFFGRFGHQKKIRTNSLGSGVVLDLEGHIITNEHVIRKASQVHVTLSDKTTLEAKLISADADNDLAVLKVEPSDKLQAAPIGTSSDLMIGETAIALGNPFGLENSVSVGVISAKNRSITAEGEVVFTDLVQTDAAVNPGNSGGPLLNIRGEVIGINTAVHAEGQGISFAIPVDKVVAILADLLDYRVLKEIWIGVELQRLTPEMSQTLGTEGEGVIVSEVGKGSPAEKAGLAVWDVITSVDGKKVSTVLDFNRQILGHEKGDSVQLDYRRKDRDQKATIKLAAVPKLSTDELISRKLGVEVQAMTTALARRLGLRAAQGLVITKTENGGPAAAAGLRPLDVIVQIGRFRLTQPDHLGLLLQQVKTGASIQVVIVRRDYFGRAVVKVR